MINLNFSNAWLVRPIQTNVREEFYELGLNDIELYKVQEM